MAADAGNDADCAWALTATNVTHTAPNERSDLRVRFAKGVVGVNARQ
jgi:hypothetical protein